MKLLLLGHHLVLLQLEVLVHNIVMSLEIVGVCLHFVVSSELLSRILYDGHLATTSNILVCRSLIDRI